MNAGSPEIQASYFILNGARYMLIGLVPLTWFIFEAGRGGDGAVTEGAGSKAPKSPLLQAP